MFLRTASELFIPIVVAVLASYALEPIVRRLHAIGIPRVIGAGLLLAALVAGAAALLYGIRGDISDAAAALPRAMRPAFARPAEDLRPRCAPVVGISWGSWPTRALPAHGDSLASCVVAGREGGSTVLSVLFPC